MFLDGIGIGGYRSFGDFQFIGPLKKINLLIGKNNSGKSNILHFLYQHLRNVKDVVIRDQTFDFPNVLDRHVDNTKEVSFSLALNIDNDLHVKPI